MYIQLDEVVKIEDLSDNEFCDPFLIKLEQVAILIGVRRRLLQDEASAYFQSVQTLWMCMTYLYASSCCASFVVHQVVVPALL